MWRKSIKNTAKPNVCATIVTPYRNLQQSDVTYFFTVTGNLLRGLLGGPDDDSDDEAGPGQQLAHEELD